MRVPLQRSSVLPTRAFSESISNVNISFCTPRNIFIWVLVRDVIVGGCSSSSNVGLWRKSGPWTCAWPPWTWCWLSQLAWYPRNRQSGLFLETATWRCQASFWSILPPLLPHAQVLVHSCCPQNRVNDECMQMWFIFFYLLYYKIFTWSALRSFSAHDNTNESWRSPLIG